MTRVTSPEGDFLAVARALFGASSYGSVEPILRNKSTCPGLGHTAMRLFEETLAKGTARFVAKLGWRSIPRPSLGRAGRLWDCPLPPIAFSSYAFVLVRWLVEEPLTEPRALRELPKTPWDALLAERACALTEGTACGEEIAKQDGVRASAFAWLAHPTMLRGACPVDWERAIADGAVVLEAMQDPIASACVALDEKLAEMTEPKAVAELGEERAQVLEAFLTAAIKRDRIDLASFLVDLARARVLRPFTGEELHALAPLRDRTRAERARGAQLGVAMVLQSHHEELRHTPYFEDAYARAQLLLARWEHLGNDGFARAKEVLARHQKLGG